VLLATSDHFGHGLFALVQRVLNQVYLARRNGMEPAVFLGERTFMELQACEYGVNPYHHLKAGDNVWEYWFEQPGNYTIGASTLRGERVSSIQVTTVEASAEFPIRSYGYKEVRKRSFRAAHQLLGDGGSALVKRWIRAKASRTFELWRERSRHILGVHMRGTDKVVRPKVPPEAYTPFIDAYVAAHEDALVFVATDDRKYAQRLGARYGYLGDSPDDGDVGTHALGSSIKRARLVSRGRGYSDATWGGEADFNKRRMSGSGMAKGVEVLLDALLLSKCDFILISMSAVSEFALWISPHLWSNHLDLQATDRLSSQSLPTWARYVPGAAAAVHRGLPGSWRRAVGDAFCTAMAAACANETGRLYVGRHCSKCMPLQRVHLRRRR